MLKIRRRQNEKVWIFSVEGEVLGSIVVESKYAHLAFGHSSLVYRREETLNEEELQLITEWEVEHSRRP